MGVSKSGPKSSYDLMNTNGDGALTAQDGELPEQVVRLLDRNGDGGVDKVELRTLTPNDVPSLEKIISLDSKARSLSNNIEAVTSLTKGLKSGGLSAKEREGMTEFLARSPALDELQRSLAERKGELKGQREALISVLTSETKTFPQSMVVFEANVRADVKKTIEVQKQAAIATAEKNGAIEVAKVIGEHALVAVALGIIAAMIGGPIALIGFFVLTGVNIGVGIKRGTDKASDSLTEQNRIETDYDKKLASDVADAIKAKEDEMARKNRSAWSTYAQHISAQPLAAALQRPAGN